MGRLCEECTADLEADCKELQQLHGQFAAELREAAQLSFVDL